MGLIYHFGTCEYPPNITTVFLFTNDTGFRVSIVALKVALFAPTNGLKIFVSSVAALTTSRFLTGWFSSGTHSVLRTELSGSLSELIKNVVSSF